MTDKEIIKALECCYRKGGTPCRDCPFNEFEDCNDVLMADYVFNLINRQQEEIDNLREHLKRVCAERDARICTNNFIKSEAVKEFANILKNKIQTECNPYGKPTFDYDTSIAIMHYIDKLVEEMVGDEK